MPNDTPTTEAPALIFTGGSDELRLEEGGKVYHPGDALPRNLSRDRLVGLRAAGIRIERRHTEPILTPDGAPATMAAAEQIDPPAGGPAVVAAVQDVPKDEPSGQGTAHPARGGSK